jgi:hypothetical protein
MGLKASWEMQIVNEKIATLRLGIYHSLFGSCIEGMLAKYRAAGVGIMAQNRVGNLRVSNLMTAG